MTLYEIIYSWFVTYVFDVGTYSDYEFTIGNDTIEMSAWLSATCTIAVLIALSLFLFLAVKWLFRLFAGLIGGIGR